MPWAEQTLLDIRQRFIRHKEAFGRVYAEWPDEKQAYVVDFLGRKYQVGTARVRKALFGHEATLTELPRVTQPDLMMRVGPWGPVSRGRV